MELLMVLNQFKDMIYASQTGWFNDDPVKMVLLNDFFEIFPEILFGGATDTSS
jgi:hypothetical protein